MKAFAMTEKRVRFMAAARDNLASASRTDMARAKRLYNFHVKGLPGYFNTQADDLENSGYIKVGGPLDGQSQWGARKVELTDKGREALAKFKI